MTGSSPALDDIEREFEDRREARACSLSRLLACPPSDVGAPIRRDGEPWSVFADRWSASPQGRARIAYGRRLNAILGPFHAAEEAGLYPTDPF